MLSGPHPSLAFSDIGHEAPWFLIVLLEVDGHTDKFTRDENDAGSSGAQGSGGGTW